MRALAFLLGVVVLATPAFAQADDPIDLVIVPRTVVAVREIEGDYSQLAGAFGELITYLTEQGLSVAGPGYSVFNEDPKAVPESRLKSAAVIPVDLAEKDVGLYPKGDVRLRIEPARLVLATIHRGPFAGVRVAFERLRRGLGDRGVKYAGLSEHVYVSDVTKTPPADLISIARIHVQPTGPSAVGIYAGRGTFGPGVIALSRALSIEKITVRPVSAEEVLDGKLPKRCRTLIVPGGWAADYKEALGAKGAKRIKAFVGRGGGYLGVCAGAFFAAERIVWEGEEVPYPLDLFPGVPTGPVEEIAKWPGYATARIRFRGKHAITKGLGDNRTVLYYGGPVLAPEKPGRVTVLATYGDTERPAMVAFKAGRGRVVLSGIHPEIQLGEDRDEIGWPAEEVEKPDPDTDHDLLFRMVRWTLGKLR